MVHVGDLLQCNEVRVRIFPFICMTFSFKISSSESDFKLSPSSSLSTLLLCRSCYVVASSLSTAPWKWNICSVLFVSIAVVSIFFAGSFFLTNDHRGFSSVKNWCCNLIWTKFLWAVICIRIHNSWFKSWNLWRDLVEVGFLFGNCVLRGYLVFLGDFMFFGIPYRQLYWVPRKTSSVENWMTLDYAYFVEKLLCVILWKNHLVVIALLSFVMVFIPMC